jgi:hypothetical protein
MPNIPISLNVSEACATLNPWGATTFLEIQKSVAQLVLPENILILLGKLLGGTQSLFLSAAKEAPVEMSEESCIRSNRFK